MVFIDRFNILDDDVIPPTKAYVHSFGFTELYHNSVEEARVHLEESLKRICLFDRRELVGALPHHPEDTSFFICVVWGSPTRSKRIIDCSGYANYSGWPGNPDQYSFVLQDDVLIHPSINTCGDGVILLGMEEEHRRKTRNLKEYLREGIDLEELNRRLQPESR